MAEIPPPASASSDRPGSDAVHPDAARLARAVMREQAALSIRVAAIFLALIFGLPLVNWLLPNIAQARVGGFTLTWLILGVLFYPITWFLSGYFVRASDRIETEIARAHGAEMAAVEVEEGRAR